MAKLSYPDYYAIIIQATFHDRRRRDLLSPLLISKKKSNTAQWREDKQTNSRKHTH
jgi:hypothetical protein